jgi:hypothetical protein
MSLVGFPRRALAQSGLLHCGCAADEFPPRSGELPSCAFTARKIDVRLMASFGLSAHGASPEIGVSTDDQAKETATTQLP